MSRVGPVGYCDIRRDYGVVEFMHYEDMKRAVRKLDDTKMFSNGESNYIHVYNCYRSRHHHTRSRSRSRSSSYDSRSSSRSYSSDSRSSSRSRSRSRSKSTNTEQNSWKKRVFWKVESLLLPISSCLLTKRIQMSKGTDISSLRTTLQQVNWGIQSIHYDSEHEYVGAFERLKPSAESDGFPNG